MITDNFNIAFKNMKKRRLRAFLTLVGILISIATIFVLFSLSIGLKTTIQEQFELLGTDKFFIQPRGQFGPPGSGSAATLTEDDVDVVDGISGVKDVTSYLIGNVKIEYRKTLRFGTTIGIEPDKLKVAFGSYDVEEGRNIKEGTHEILLGYDYAHSDFIGRPVNMGDKILINDVEFKIVGIIEKIGNSADDRQTYISKDVLRELLDIPNRVDAIVVQVNDQTEINNVADNVERRLARFRDVKKDNIDFSVLTPEELLKTVGTVLNIVTVFLAGIALISLLVGGINIMNSMFTSVLERTREIGVMKAIGAKNSDILSIFVIESGFLGMIGGILGVLLGMGIGKTVEYVAINQLGTNLLKVIFPWYLILGCLLFAFLAGAISGLYPAWRATKIKPVEALRYE